MAAMRANLESLNVGDTFLTKYEIRGLIGRGGQATVYHSYDTFIDRHVAIKIMADAFDSKREHSRRAQMEARVLCKLHHPNIVHVYDAGSTDNGAIYIIMELLEGRTLRDVLLEHRRLTVYESLCIGAPLADGVQRAQHQHVIHRDLKPENVFIVSGNTVKVLDFGIAKFLTLTGITTQRDTLQGTLWYISPEHIQGYGVTARSDIYALGSMLYEAISGTPPCLVGLHEVTTQSLAWSQISRVPPQLDEFAPDVPPHVGRLIQRMLVKDPSERPSSMAEVSEALRAACMRIQSESVAAPAALRQLWCGAESAEEPIEQVSDTATPGDSAPGAAHRRKVLQPTIDLARLEAATATQSPTALVESGIIGASTYSATGPRGATTALDNGTASGSTEAGSATSEPIDPKLAASRRRLFLVAVVLGAVCGLGLGFSNRFASKLPGGFGAAPLSNQSNDPPAAQTSHGISAVAPDSPIDAATPFGSQTATRVPSPVQSATRPSAANAKVQSVRAPAVASNTPTGPAPRPRYSVDDLE